MARKTITLPKMEDITAIQEDISTLNGKIKYTSFSITPSAAGNGNYIFSKNVWVIAAASSISDTVVIPYPGGGGATGGRAGWWFNIHTASAAFPPSTVTQTIYVAYIEM